METVYYHLDARRVSTCDMASGETSPQRRSYAVLRKVEEKRSGQPGKVLDMDAYRRRLEVAEKRRAEVVAPYDEEERYESVIPATIAPAASHRSRRVRVFGLTLDAFATVAILVMATVVVTAFLPFL